MDAIIEVTKILQYSRHHLVLQIDQNRTVSQNVPTDGRKNGRDLHAGAELVAHVVEGLRAELELEDVLSHLPLDQHLWYSVYDLAFENDLAYTV